MTASVQAKRGKYYVVISYKDEQKGWQHKWKPTNLSVQGNNKRKAEQMRKEILRQWEENAQLSNFEDILFSDYICKWLEDVKHTIAESTYCTYRAVIHGIIAPYFAEKKIKLSDLKAYHIQDFYTYKMQKDNVSANTIHHYQANIHRALSYAVKTERIKDNPAALVELPKKKKHIADFYTVNELKTFLQTAKKSNIVTPILLAAWFGMRRGEIMGLKWNCIDFDNRTLSVKGTIIKAGKWVYRETAKTKSSFRSFPMTDEAVHYLLALKEEQERNRAYYGKHYSNEGDGFVCVTAKGELVKPDYVTRHFEDVCKESGLRKLTLHELRHSNVSLLLSNGITLKEIQEWTGHSSYSTTADIYAHLQAQNKLKLSQSIEQSLAE